MEHQIGRQINKKTTDSATGRKNNDGLYYIGNLELIFDAKLKKTVFTPPSLVSGKTCEHLIGNQQQQNNKALRFRKKKIEIKNYSWWDEEKCTLNDANEANIIVHISIKGLRVIFMRE